MKSRLRTPGVVTLTIITSAMKQFIRESITSLSKQTKTLVFTVLYSICTVSSAYSVIANPDFESGGLSPWYQWIDGGGDMFYEEDWNVSSADSHSGLYSATVVGNKGLRQDFAPVATDTINAITFWMKHPSLTSSIAASGVNIFYSDETKSTPFIDASGTTDWQFYDVTADVLAEKLLVGFSVTGYLRTDTAVDRTFFDDITINAVPTNAVPTPPILYLFGTGLIGLVVMARRKAA